MRLYLILFFYCSLNWAGTTIKGLRIWAAPDHTRLVFDISQPVKHDIFTLHDPERVVIDFKSARLKKIPKKIKSNHYLKRIRSAPKGQNYRVVLDLKKKVTIKSFLLKPSGKYGHRLVIDLYDQAHHIIKTAPHSKQRDVLIVIDAGHGGEDPGALGKHSQEKQITLAIARRLKKLIDREPGMKAILTRHGDYGLGLRQRSRIARRHQADFFISIHADSFKNRKAKGASVFILSRRGASSEAAAWLAKKENEDDLIGGISLDDKDQMVASVLLDLAQSGTIAASSRAAQKVLHELSKITQLHGKKVQSAAFIVLKSPDVPSMLVETGFVSNPYEEKRLNHPRYQQKIAAAIFRGIKHYFYAEPPPDSRIAALKQNKKRRYVIQRGDTLSSIAQKHRVKLSDLKRINRIQADRIKVGQILTIPRA